MAAGHRIVIAVIFFLCALPQAFAGAKLALLIGNQSYSHKVGPLKNPAHDIGIVGSALSQVHFDVTRLTNATKEQMDEQIRRYVDKVRAAGPGAISFFYYSGHGALKPDTNENYLIPVDLDRADTADIWYRAIEQQTVIEHLQRASNATHFAVFDACRNELNLGGTAGKGIGDEKGFVPFREVSGILIAYATAQKKTAADTGTFARILAEELVKPDVEAVSAFREVQLRVKDTMHQEPWMSLNSIPRVYLAGTQKMGELSPPPAPPAPPGWWSRLHDNMAGLDIHPIYEAVEIVGKIILAVSTLLGIVFATLKYFGVGAAARKSQLAGVFVNIPEPQGFIGRDREIENIHAHFFPEGAKDPAKARKAKPPKAPRRLLIHAGPGFGKTSLARKYANKYKACFHIAYLLEAENISDLLDQVISLGQGPTGTRARPAGSKLALEDACEALRSRFGGVQEPCLLIFDNVDPDPKSLKTVLTLFASLPACVRIISTARFHKWDENAKEIELTKLDKETAAELLMALAGRKTAEERGEALKLAATLDCLPLALNHAGMVCRQIKLSEYEQKYLFLRDYAPPGADNDRSVYATVSLGLEQAKKIGGVTADDVTALADFVSYCAPDRIPFSLYKQAVADTGRLVSAAHALIRVGLVQEVSPEKNGDGANRDYQKERAAADGDGDSAISMHRLVQYIIRRDADANGRSAAVIDRLVPFLYEQLKDIVEAGSSTGAQLRFEKYFPHLLHVLPELDAPDFRGNENSDILDDVAKLIVLALSRQYSAKDEAYPAGLPGLLACSYEVDPLSEPLNFLLGNLRGKKEEWHKFRDACLERENYVLRYALADALAEAVEADAKTKTPFYDLNEVTDLVKNPTPLNHFELGGYALKSLYSNPANFANIDTRLLGQLAAHKCYPGRPILGDLLLNLVYQGRDVQELLPPRQGNNARFWEPIWDFIAYDVNAIRAADYRNKGEIPPESESKAVKDEYAYLLQLEAWQKELREEFAGDPSISIIVDKYLSIGANTDPIDEAEEALRKLGESGRLLPLLRLLFGHPLWSVSESAASTVAGLVRKAKTAKKTKEAEAYIKVTQALFAPDLPWRVRYGAAEAACQFRLDDEPKHATFFESVKLFYNDPISKLRGLSAENLFFVILNASDKQRQNYETQFKQEICAWLKDEDCWVLEHIYRYFNALHKRGANVDHFMSAGQSPLLTGLDKWWTKDREEFLKYIETQKEARTRRIAG